MAISKILRVKISHTKFILVFSLLLYTVCNAINSDKLVKWFAQKDGVNYVALSAYLLAGLCVFIAFFTLFAHRRTIKPLAIVLVVVSTAVTYFIAKYNVAIDSSMVMNTIHTDATEVGQLLSWQMLPYAALLIAVPVLLILFVEIDFQAPRKCLLRSTATIAITMIVALAALLLNYNAIHRAGNVSNKYIVYSLVPINFLSASISVISKSVQPYFHSDQKDVQIAGSISSQENLVVVLAIGESSRQKSFSLYGYNRRNTNPQLQKVSDLHLLNGIAKRGTTLYALPEILESSDIKLTSVVSKLGVPTACYVNYTLYDNCASVGEIEVSKCAHDGKCYDEDVIPLLASNLKSYDSGYRFVVLHLGGGSHGPTYSDRHPPEFQQFKPMCNDADMANQCTLDQVHNSYDNTILYVDHVVSQALQTLDKASVPYVFIYLSDHGESLMEDGRMFHGMPPGIALPPEQAQIPLLVKSSIPISIVKRDAYQQQDVFDTVLDLFSIETTTFDKRGSFVKKHPDAALLSARTSAAQPVASTN